jgi:N-acetylmuramoyl-L-alanine amidase
MRFLLTFSLFLTASFNVFSQTKTIKLVIDPGHGGSDPGHVSEYSGHLSEKELNLIISQKVGAYIEDHLQNIEIIYTREDDSYPTLDERVELANAENADYFISIHCNANASHGVCGTECHVHSKTSTKAVKLANEIQKQFTDKAGRKSRGVKDTEDRTYSLQVLKYTEMTSVLVECGFMTNESEAKYLNTVDGQEDISSSIYNAFRSFVIAQHPDISFMKAENKDSENVASSNINEGYTIQIMSSKTPLETSKDEFQQLGIPVSRNKLNTTSSYKYQYTVGTYNSKDEAMKDLEKIQTNGFKDAFITKSGK